MPMVGQVLRRARERDGLSLEELSRRTKIKVRLLEAIENNDFDSLPGGIFTRGFLRTYAREVALDPEAIISRYMAQAEPRELFPMVEKAPAEPEPPPPFAKPTSAKPEVLTRLAANRYRPLRLVVGLVAVTAVSFYFGSLRPTHPEAVAASAATLDVPPVAGTSGAARDEELPTEAIGLKVDLTPRAPCWIAATADGKPALAKLMSAQDPYRIEAQQEVTLRVGDPGALAIAVNGVPGRPLGQPGMPVTVRITRDNYRDFLVRQ